jgi:predicted nucleotidyltransferase
MLLDGDSMRKRDPTFIISVGTQVVLKVTKPTDDGRFRPAGTVGVVVESPPHNRLPYLVRFADGETVSAMSHELALRRREVDEELAESTEDLRPWIIYRCQVGSKAFGLSTDESDDDLRGIFLPPARLTWSLHPVPEQLESGDGHRDEVYWELEKYLRLALKANPSVLETLWTPLVEYADQTAQELREMRRAFLSKHLYKTYSGYVLSQFRRMANAVEKRGAHKPKHAMHLVRLLYAGIAALGTGEIQIDVTPHRDELLRIRAGEMTFDEVKSRALALDAVFQEAFERTALPEQPDFRRVDDFLIRARRRMVDA